MATPSSTGVTSVALSRARDYYGAYISIRVLIDGENELGTILYGRRRVFLLPPGLHSLSVADSWCRSPPFEVEVRPGQLVELEASIRWRGLLFSLGVLVMLIRPRRFFVIRATSGPVVTPPHHDLWEVVAVFTGGLLTVCLFGCLVLILEFVLKLIWPGLGVD